jgi:hypothetical protein
MSEYAYKRVTGDTPLRPEELETVRQFQNRAVDHVSSIVVKKSRFAFAVFANLRGNFKPQFAFQK